jgi:hypothetical protein
MDEAAHPKEIEVMKPIAKATLMLISVLGMASLTLSQTPEDATTPAPASLHDVQPGKLANYDRTYAVHSATILIERDLMLEALRNQSDFANLDFVLVENRDAAEVYVEVAYVPWTFDYTFKVIDQKTSVVIGAGKVTAFNGYLAAPALAKKIATQMKKWRSQTVVTTSKKD